MAEDYIEHAQELEAHYRQLLADRSQVQCSLLVKIETFLLELQRPCVMDRIKHIAS